MNLRLLICIITFIVMFLHSCSDNQITGGCTETSNQATVYCVNGDPAIGAKVIFVPADYAPNSINETDSIDIDSTRTNEFGNYSFSSIKDGTYNIWYNKENRYAFRSSLSIIDGKVESNISDTLSNPGSVLGVVKLLPEHDPREVYLLLIGSERFTVPFDSIGNFVFSNLPEGEYTIRCISSNQDYGVLDTTIEVIEGETVTLKDTLYLPYLRLPIPDSLLISYDTLKQIVSLKWQCEDADSLSGFNIYRQRIGEERFHLLNLEPVETMSYVDSSILNNNEESIINNNLYRYKITAVDKEGLIGCGATTLNVKICSVYKFEERGAVDSIGILGEGNMTMGVDGLLYYVSSNFPRITVVDPLNLRDQRYINIPDSAYPYDISQLTDSTLVIATNNGLYHIDTNGEFLYWYNLNLLKFDSHGDSCIYYAARTEPKINRDKVVSFNMKTGISKEIDIGLVYDSSRCDINDIKIDGDSAIILLRDFDRYKTMVIDIKSGLINKGLSFPARGIINDFDQIDSTLVLLGNNSITCYRAGEMKSRCNTMNQKHLVSISSQRHITVDYHGTIRRYAY